MKALHSDYQIAFKSIFEKLVVLFFIFTFKKLKVISENDMSQKQHFLEGNMKISSSFDDLTVSENLFFFFLMITVVNDNLPHVREECCESVTNGVLLIIS